jgi:hypothetical protein
MTHQIALPLPFAVFTGDQPLLPVRTPEERVCRDLIEAAPTACR